MYPGTQETSSEIHAHQLCAKPLIVFFVTVFSRVYETLVYKRPFQFLGKNSGKKFFSNE